MDQTNEEYVQLVNEIEQLKSQLKYLNEKIKKIYEKRSSLLKEVSSNEWDSVYKESNDQINKIIVEEDIIYKKINSICNELLWVSPPIKTNGVIEIRKMIDGRENDQNNILGNYSICLSGEKKVVGEICYRGYHVSEFMGDIGYSIDMNFRGNNYAYQALCLLGELLKENGVEDFWAAAYKNNIPSLKTIEKYGGVFVDTNNNVCLYRAQTFINDKQMESNIIKK